MAADAPAAPQTGDGVDDPRPVQVIDTPLVRVHRTTDLIALLATVLGMVIVLVIGSYAEGTTVGITNDVQGVSEALQRLLVAPVILVSGIVTLVLPGAVVIDLAVRREPRRLLEVLGAAVLGFVLALLAAFLVTHYGADEIVRALSVPRNGVMVVALPAYISGVAALLTAAGRRSTNRTLGISWNVLWIALAVAVISGIVSLPAALVTVLIGRFAGLGFRYALGSTADRAYGDALVDGIRRAGFEPRRLVRADATSSYAPPELDEVSTALGRSRTGRVYALTTIENHHLLVVALDGDQHVVGFIARLWSSIRLRGISARADVSLRHTAEATALVSYAARNAGVRTARVLGMSQARDTMIIVYQRPSQARSLTQTPVDEITDAALDAIWAQVGKAHNSGISHRAISADTVLLGYDAAADEPTVWLSSWEFGEVATSALARRIDRAQVVAMLAPLVGVERAVASAFRALPDAEVQQFAPLLQAIVLPKVTRAAVRASEIGLSDVRAAIVDLLPVKQIANENITRFGLKTVLLILLGLIAVSVILTSFNTADVIEALERADPKWLLIALGWSIVSFMGATLAMVAFSPVRLPFNRVFLIQIAAAYVALAVPAGVGPAAMNLRLLTRRDVPTPLAAATVALVQLTSIVTTVGGLLILTLATGSEGTLARLPGTSILIVVGATAALIAAALIVPGVRSWASRRVVPMARQTWPRLSAILGQPWRLLLGLFGNLLITVAFIGAFYSTLEAFGQHLPIIDVAIILLLGNAVAAAVPTPGGIGTVDFALIAGLTGAGVPPGVAPSVAIIYRVISYWIRIPMGWVAMKYLQRKGEL